MNKKTGKKELASFVLFHVVIVILILIAVAFHHKTHPGFDEKISGKEATVVSESATIYYDEPLGRETDTVAKSQKVILTGKMAHFFENNFPMMEVRLENDTLAWISKRHIAISE